MSATLISIEKLQVSPHNVRKAHSKSGIEEMKASILAHGLMQNLVVTKNGNGTYYVVAGARRLTALQALNKDGKFPEGCMVPCLVEEDSTSAAEMSLAENTVREAMNPADEFEAFAALSKDHKAAEIAARFGVTEKHVLQRMKLGKIAPEILKAYREEKLDLEALMAYAITDDHNSQRKVYKSQNAHHHAYSIKRLLTENKASPDSKVTKFVGIASYRKAGGIVTANLFNDEEYLDDATLLQKLAHEKLHTAAEKLKAEGWGWVEIALDADYQFTSRCQQLEASPIDVPKNLIDKQAKLKAEYAKIEKEWHSLDSEDPRFEDVDEKLMDAQGKLEELEEKFEEYAAFLPDQVKVSGCYLSVDSSGKLSVRKGLVKPEDKKKISNTGDDSQGAEKPKEKGFSQSLIDSLKQYRLQISQARLAANPQIAFDLLIFKAALPRFTNSSLYKGPDVSFSQTHFREQLITGAKNTVAGKELLALQEKLNLNWTKEKTESAKFAALSELPFADKLAIVAYCTARTITPQLSEKNALETALAYTEGDVSAYWRPTAENYFTRLTRDQLIAAGIDLFGKPWGSKVSAAKKAELVKELDKAFADPKKYSGNNKELENKLRTWLPEGMAFTALEKRAKKKAA